MKAFLFLYKMPEQHLWNSFSLYVLVEIMQLVDEISNFLEVLASKKMLEF